jgi:uncharacterized repeat protein (TIGR01451 family)
MPRGEKQFSNPARKGEIGGGLSWAAERDGGTVSFLAMSKVQRAFLRSLVLVVVGCVLLAPAQAQFGQQGTKLVGSTLTGPANQGAGVSLSWDGNTMIVGGPADNSYAGAAWIYTRSSGTTWSQVGSKLTPGTNEETGAGQFGFSVAISGDGNTAIVGAPNDHAYRGAVWIFVRSGDSWVEQAGPLVGSDNTDTAERGWSVAISYYGNVAVVGGPTDNSSLGAVWAWQRTGTGTGTSWSQQGGKLTPSDASGNPVFGHSVGLSSDGNTFIAGGPSDSSSAGAAWIFTYSGGWSQSGTKLVGSGATGSTSQQGYSVAISGDGETVIIGGPQDNSNTGGVWVFRPLLPGYWYQQAGPVVGGGNTGAAKQGSSVGLSSDGNRAIVGGNANNGNVGGAWVFIRSGGNWSQSGSEMNASDASGNSQQGFAVAMSEDGSTAAVGGPDDNSNAGAAWAYIPVPDMTIAIAHNGTFHRGDTSDTYTITVTNSGLAPTNAQVTVTIPIPASSGLSYVSASGGSWSCSEATSTPSYPTPPGHPPNPSGTPAPVGVPTVTCQRSDVLAAGSSYSPNLTLTVGVSTSAPPALTIDVTVAGGGETNTSNDSGSDTITLPPIADLVVSVSHSGSLYVGRTAASGDPLPYIIEVNNIGNGSTSGTVTVVDSLPSGMTATAISGGGWSCTLGSLTCTRNDSLAASTSWSGSNAITVLADVTGGAGTIGTNTATVSGGGEVNTSNDTGTDKAKILAASSAPGLSVSVSHVGNFSKSVGVGTFVIVVTNTGGGPTSGTVTVTAHVQSPLSATAIDGGRGWNCSLNGGGVSFLWFQTIPALSCTRTDPLPAGLSYHFITVTVSVPSTTVTSVTNSATVSGGSVSGSSGSDLVLITP